MSDIEELVREFYSALSEYDLDSIMNYLADDFKMITVANTVVDKHGFRDVFYRVKDAFPDRKITIERIMTKDNAAMAELTWIATHTGEYYGYPATNNRIEVPGVDILEFESGKVKLLKDIFNWRILERGMNPQV